MEERVGLVWLGEQEGLVKKMVYLYLLEEEEEVVLEMVLTTGSPLREMVLNDEVVRVVETIVGRLREAAEETVKLVEMEVVAE